MDLEYVLPSIIELKNILEMYVCLCHQYKLTAHGSLFSVSHVSNAQPSLGDSGVWFRPTPAHVDCRFY